MKLSLPIIGLSLLLPLKAIAGIIPVYYEAIVTGVESRGELLDVVGVSASDFNVGQTISGTINIDESLLWLNPSNIGPDFASFYIQSTPFEDRPGGFAEGPYTDHSDFSLDILKYRSGLTDSFTITDHAQEGFNSFYAKSQMFTLSVADSAIDFITSGEYSQLGFELFDAELFSGSMYFDSNDFNIPNSYADLAVVFDLTYLRVRDGNAVQVSAPSLTILSGLLFLFLSRRNRS